MINIFKKFITWLFLGGVVLASGGVLLTDNTPEHLKLKAPKEMLLGSKENNGIVKYAYKTKKIKDNDRSENVLDVGISRDLVVMRELKEKRTKYSKTYLTDKDEYILEVVSGVPQYYEDTNGKWWQAEYATTTKSSFKKQTKKSLIGRLFGLSVAFADTSTFYPDPNVESTSVDGTVAQEYGDGSGVAWATLRGASGSFGNDSGTTAYAVYIASDTGTNEWKVMCRGIMLFDTSALTAGATVTGATLSLDGGWHADTLSIAPDINIYSSAPASNTAIAGGDYDSFGTTAFSTAISYAGWDTGGYNDFVLNASGLSAIDKTGVSKFGTRNANYDVANNPPSWSSGNIAWMNYNTAEKTGTASDPKLVVTYTPAGGGGADYNPNLNRVIIIQ